MSATRPAPREMGVQFYEIDKTAFIEGLQSRSRRSSALRVRDNARYFAEFQSYLDK